MSEVPTPMSSASAFADWWTRSGVSAFQPWRPMPGAELLRRYEGRTNPLGFSTMTHVVAERNWQASLRDTKPHEQRAGWR